MPVNQYGLLTDDQNKLGTSGTGIIDSGNQQNQATPQQNAFSAVTPGQVSAAGAAPVIPQAQQYAFNSKYAAQDVALQQMLADKQMEQNNQLFAAQADFDRQRNDAGTTRQRALDALIAKFATSGMFGSSADAEARGNLETDYNKYLSDLALQLGNTQQGIRGNYANTVRNVNDRRTQMWTQQGEEDLAERRRQEDIRLQAQRDQDAANNARMVADANRAAAEAAASNRTVINLPSPYSPGAGGAGGAGGGGGGGGGGGYGWNIPWAGIAPSDTWTDIMNQIGLLNQNNASHQLSLLYSTPEMGGQAQEVMDAKKGLGRLIYERSTPGTPGYMPTNYSNPGGFW